MKNMVLVLIMALSSFTSFGADLVVPKKSERKPSSAAVKVTGAKAEAIFRAILASDESLIDNCTAHTCNFTSKCEYDQTSSQKYVCTIVP